MDTAEDRDANKIKVLCMHTNVSITTILMNASLESWKAADMELVAKQDHSPAARSHLKLSVIKRL